MDDRGNFRQRAGSMQIAISNVQDVRLMLTELIESIEKFKVSMGINNQKYWNWNVDMLEWFTFNVTKSNSTT